MGYILVEESVFKKLIERIAGKEEADIRYDFTESDYWMNGKDVCDYLHISQALLNSYRRDNTLCFCKIKEIYHYKRADVYKLKVKMDKELLESGLLLGECIVVNNEEQAHTAFEEDNGNLEIGVQEV